MKKQIITNLLVALSIVMTNNTDAQTQPSLLHVDGRFLIDDCGDTIILKGVNVASIYYGYDDFGVSQIEEIAQTGANSVRIVLAKTFKTFPPPNYTEVINTTLPSHVEPIIQACLDNKMIPVLELHDFTGQSTETAINGANGAVAWWTQVEVKNLLLQYQNYLIINLANEPSPAVNITPAERLAMYNAYKTGIQTMRAAGYTCPIMLDGMHWGKDHSIFLEHGAALLADDEAALEAAQGEEYANGNLLFSVHLYWPSNTSGAPYWTHTQQAIADKFTAMGNSNLPFVFGELASDDVAEDWGNQNNGCPTYTPYSIDYEYMMELSADNHFGWFVWWWTSQCDGVAPYSNPLNMSHDGTFAQLYGDGLVMATTSPYSISNTAVRPTKLVTGACAMGNVGIEKIDETEIKLFPNPVKETLTISSSIPFIEIKFTDISGKVIEENQINAVSNIEISTSQLPSGVYFVRITDKNHATRDFKVVKE